MIKKIKDPKIAHSRFLIIPTPLPDELLSSWLVRTSYAHMTHPHTFASLHFSEKKFPWHINFDAAVSDNLLEKIAFKSAKPFNALFKMSLRSYSGYLQENIIPNGLNVYISTLRYCPVCLREDTVPYYRKAWHLLPSTVCFKHRCFLRDQCPACKALLNISKMYQNKLPFTFCHQCGYDLRKARKLSVPKTLRGTDWRMMKKFHNILNRGYARICNRPVYSFHFFEILLHLCKLILNRHNLKTLSHTKTLQHIISATDISPSHPTIKQLSIRHQYIVISSIMRLFENFPKSFIRFIEQNGLSHWALVKDMRQVPFWYANFLDTYVPQISYRSSLISAEEAKRAMLWLESNQILANKANLKRLLDCDFFHNQLGDIIFTSNKKEK